MAVEINGKVYRNLPEQVKKNQEDIEGLEEVVKSKISVEFDNGAVCTLQDFIKKCQAYTEDDIGTKVKLTNIIEGLALEYILVAIDHFDLANGLGKAHTTWMPTTILNDNVYLALPWCHYSTDGNNGHGNNKSGYPTALGLRQQEQAVFELFPIALQRAIKSVEIPCYLPGYHRSTNYIAKVFSPSASEVGYSRASNLYVPETGDGTKFAYFEEGNTYPSSRALRQVKNLNGNYASYWLRTPMLAHSYSWWFVFNDGNVYYDYPGNAYGLAPTFCI